ncbi:hypothetical protein B0H34DRAFT_457687 [Crassisporium funariophilum]|nr:hypothetical protein B0H34DRAFT_457687 [Crassisporium funariophilum]
MSSEDIDISTTFSPALRDQLARLDAKISQVERDTVSLRRQRNVLLPALALPELLTVIFEFAVLPVEPYDADYNMMVEAQSPLLLGMVCSTWRSVAIGTPSLWSNISLILPAGGDETQMAILQHWLMRARDCPLTVTIEPEDREETDQRRDDSFVALLGVLSKRSKFWHTIDLTLPQCSTRWISALADINSDFPSLVNITLHDNSDLDSREESHRWFEVAPRLRSVTLFGIAMESLQLPWGQLEDVSVSCRNAAQLLQICPHLRRCTLNHAIVKGALPDRIQHDHLQSLAIYAYRQTRGLQDPYYAWLGSLILPVLHELIIHFPEDLHMGLKVLHMIPSLVTRSSCNLQHLHLINARQDELIECLALLPSLTSLFLIDMLDSHHRPADPDLLFQRLNSFHHEQTTSARTCLVPKLENFRYHGGAMSAENLVGFMSGRWHTDDMAIAAVPDVRNIGVASLKCVRIETGMRIFFCMSEELKVLERLQEEGMEFKFFARSREYKII